MRLPFSLMLLLAACDSGSEEELRDMEVVYAELTELKSFAISLGGGFSVTRGTLRVQDELGDWHNFEAQLKGGTAGVGLSLLLPIPDSPPERLSLVLPEGTLQGAELLGAYRGLRAEAGVGAAGVSQRSLWNVHGVKLTGQDHIGVIGANVLWERLSLTVLGAI